MFYSIRRSVVGHRVIIAAALLLSQPIFGQTDADAPESNQSAYVSQDPLELRRQSNARYIGAPVTTRVIQRFEMYDPHSEAALRELAKMGFTQVILDWPQLHKAATDLGLNVVLANWWIDKTKQEDIDSGIERARAVDQDRLIGFSVMDEPGRNSPDTPFGYYIDLYEKLKPMFQKEFPNTRLEISHWGPMASWDDRYYDYFSFLYEAADVMRIMPYPDLYEAPLDDVFFMIQRSRRLMAIAEVDLPLVVILQAWVLPPRNELPKIEELRAMAYQAMLAGTETLSFFEYNLEIWKKTAGFHDEFRRLMLELTSFSDRYRDYAVTSTMNEDGIMTSVMVSPTGEQRQVEVNTRREAAGGLESLQVRITVLSPLSQPFVATACQSVQQQSRCPSVSSSATTVQSALNCRAAMTFGRCPSGCSRRQLRQSRRRLYTHCP